MGFAVSDSPTELRMVKDFLSDEDVSNDISRRLWANGRPPRWATDPCAGTRPGTNDATWRAAETARSWAPLSRVDTASSKCWLLAWPDLKAIMASVA